MTRLMGAGGAQPVKVSIAWVLRLSSWVATCLMGTGDNQRVLGWRTSVGTVGQLLEAAAGGLGGTVGDVYGFYEGGQVVLRVDEGAQGRDAEVVGAAEEDAQRVERNRGGCGAVAAACGAQKATSRDWQPREHYLGDRDGNGGGRGREEVLSRSSHRDRDGPTTPNTVPARIAHADG
jgi:hypothetical protein